ncbi:MAG: HPr family phosphocarrier protein [Clostridia bacterium]|nr:HPr family phosphocarrier protein [Clostridia bacterium]MDD4049183.1 HPr family phosphocarrier protein [Clostridia bacterium]
MRQVMIENKLGLHARPAVMFVNTASSFKSSVFLEKDNQSLNAKSIMSVLSVGISQGTKICLIIEGEDEELADKALVSLIKSNFGEK